MAELKTQPTGVSVEEFLDNVENEQRRQDALIVLEMMKEATQSEPAMWGPSIIGLGDSHLKYASGREVDWFQIGFSPRKQHLVLYLEGGQQRYQELLDKLGKYKTGKSCLYIRKLSDVNMEVLKELILESVKKFK